MRGMASLVGERMLETVRFIWQAPLVARFRGGVIASAGLAMLLAFGSYDASDPSLNTAAAGHVHNLLRGAGAVVADLGLQSIGLAAWPLAALIALYGLARAATPAPDISMRRQGLRVLTALAGVLMLAGVLAAPEPPRLWPLARGLGGFWGQALLDGVSTAIAFVRIPYAEMIAAGLLAVGSLAAIGWALSIRRSEFVSAVGWIGAVFRSARAKPKLAATLAEAPAPVTAVKKKTQIAVPAAPFDDEEDADAWSDPETGAEPKVFDLKPRAPRASGRETRENQGAFEFARTGGFHLPELTMLAKPEREARGLRRSGAAPERAPAGERARPSSAYAGRSTRSVRGRW